MIINGKISYKELEQLSYIFHEKLINSYLKKIYHYENLWLFKFNHFSFVLEPGVSIWPGSFQKREKILHSVCTKIRKEVGDNKIINFNLIENDRTIIMEFKNNYKIVIELFAKGNLILLDDNDKILVLTRIYNKCTHGEKYIFDTNNFKNFENYKLTQCKWKMSDKEIILIDSENDEDTNEEKFNIFEGMEKLWIIKNNISTEKIVKKENKQDSN